MIRKLLTMGLTLALVLGADAADAQSTLGELLDKGFKKVNRNEFVSAVSGTKVTSVRPDGLELEYGFNANGLIAGAWFDPKVRAGGGTNRGEFFGTWTMDGDGKLCAVTTSGGMRGPQSTTCNFWFRSGEEFYASASATDRAAPALKRTIKR